ncbi:MAG: HAD family hydrolase [Oscillospiraceae bacterium]|jgi:phosphoglycolate phosphatase|nr:HAD family hydrolase [Oscillospiraceae bacterium]
MIRLAIFDMDGTLLDTLEDLKEACNYSLECSGYPRRSLEDVKRRVGSGARNLVAGLAPEEYGNNGAVIDRLHDDFTAYYSEHGEDSTKPYDGTVSMLRELKKAGVRTAILSNKPDRAVGVLANRYFPGLIDLAYGQRIGVPIKPDPVPLWDVIAHFGFERHDCAYIGDSEVDIQTGLNADVMTVGVSWGFRTIDELNKAGARVIAHKAEELLSILIDK